MKQYTVGVDVGGTSIKMGLVNRSGVIVKKTTLETKQFHSNKNKLIDALVQKIYTLVESKKLKPKDIEGIGVGLPGLIDSKKGVVTFLPNVPGWRNVALKSILQKEIHIPTFIDNDVNVITLGEWKFGAGKGHKNLLCMTLGTGVGAGLVFNNELYRGEGFVAGELGHMPLNEAGPQCTCGGWGCFERYVGNADLMKKAEKIFKVKNMRPPDVRYLAEQGNIRAVQFWTEAGTRIGNGLVGVVNLLNPRLIIIGGGVSNNYKYFGQAVKDVIKKRAMKVQSAMVKVVRAKLGEGAGIIGAQVLVKESISGR